MSRFYVEENGAGGWQVRDRRDGDRVVSYSSFRAFAEKAVMRLSGGDPEWFAFYGVKAPANRRA